jgi:hypothetical protein
MVTAFVLILIYAHYNDGGQTKIEHVATAQFGSKDACEAAGRSQRDDAASVDKAYTVYYRCYNTH